MAKFSRTQLQPALLATLVCVLPVSALASNGMYLTGYGNESVMMGGADVAVARDAFAANNNPSGMTQIYGQTAEVELAVFNNISKYTDSYGNYRKEASNKNGGYTNGAYARQLENTPYAAGIALVVQGGLGWAYSGLNTGRPQL